MNTLEDLGVKALLIFLASFVTYLFGKEKYRRERSATNLTEAQDTQQMALMTTMAQREKDALQREREAQQLYMATSQELVITRQAMTEEMETLRRLSMRRDLLLARQAKQFSKLARALRQVRPELEDWIDESGYVTLDETVPLRRHTDVTALPGPVKLKLDKD